LNWIAENTLSRQFRNRQKRCRLAATPVQR
jgi:hypothetical protein